MQADLPPFKSCQSTSFIRWLQKRGAVTALASTQACCLSSLFIITIEGITNQTPFALCCCLETLADSAINWLLSPEWVHGDLAVLLMD